MTESLSLFCRENQWSDFYMIGTSVMKELKHSSCLFGEKPWYWPFSSALNIEIGGPKMIHLRLAFLRRCCKYEIHSAISSKLF